MYSGELLLLATVVARLWQICGIIFTTLLQPCYNLATYSVARNKTASVYCVSEDFHYTSQSLGTVKCAAYLAKL